MVYMAAARIVWWKIKAGKRDELISRLDGLSGELKATDGYRGMVSLKSVNNPDRLTIISFWESESAMASSQNSILRKASDAVSDLLEEPPMVANQEVHSFDMAKIMA